jgi:2-keto-3-deoxy-L-rhamnonate aldolase RhmA
MIDMEHSPFTMEQVTELVHTVYTTSQGQCLPVIRIPSHGTEYVKWALDTGAAGIIIPMVHRPSEMRDILDKALYPPQGSRSFGPYSAPFGDFHTRTFGDYYSKAKRGKIAIFPTIESREGVENVEEILRLDGVSGIFIGPYDLRLSLGLSGGSDGPETEFVAALGKIFSTGNKLAKPVGIPARGDHLSTTRTEQGASFLLSSFDYTALQAGLQADLRSAQQGVKRSTKT